MKILLKIFFGISALISFLILILFIISLVAWLDGGGNVLFPGLGLIVAMGLIVVVLSILTMVSVLITFLLYRMIFRKNL